jgi:ribulose-phosphate 3-epimerase
MTNMHNNFSLPPAHISASIMCADLTALGQEAKRLEDAGVDSIHVDIMDGHFVPNLTFGPGTVGALRRATRLPLHVHMMVSNPVRHVAAFAQAGADLFYFHIEAEPYPLRLASAINESGMNPGVAINPFTPLAALVDLPLPNVLVMSVEPGFAGQPWIPHTAGRLHELRASLGSDVQIGVDGNVSEDNALLAYENGASLFVCGTSSVFAGDDYTAAVNQMRSRLQAGPRTVTSSGGDGPAGRPAT